MATRRVVEYKDVRLPRDIWGTVPDDWVEAFEREINTGPHGPTWGKISQYAHDERDVIGFLCLESQEPNKKYVRQVKALRVSLLKTAALLKSTCHPKIGAPPDEDSFLADQLNLKAYQLGQAHIDNECSQFAMSILHILTFPKIGRKPRDSSGLPTIPNFIQIVQLAINATDSGKLIKRETNLTEDSVRAYLRRSRDFIEASRTSFILMNKAKPE